jgi:hypothetical protein
VKRQRRFSRDRNGREPDRHNRKRPARKARKRTAGVIDGARHIVERVPNRHGQGTPRGDRYNLQDGRVEIEVRRRAIDLLGAGLNHDGDVEVLPHCRHGGWRVDGKGHRRRRSSQCGTNFGKLNRLQGARRELLRAGDPAENQDADRGGDAAHSRHSVHRESSLAIAVLLSRVGAA